MLEELKQRVYEANMQLPTKGLVVFTWGNVSGIDREKGLMVIKPSGVPYEELKPSDMVVVALKAKKWEVSLILRQIPRHTLNFTENSQKSEELPILIQDGRRSGHRRGEIFRHMAQRTETIFTAAFRAREQ